MLDFASVDASAMSFFVVNFAAMMAMPLLCVIAPTLWWLFTYFAIRCYWLAKRRKVKTVAPPRNRPRTKRAAFALSKGGGNGGDSGGDGGGGGEAKTKTRTKTRSGEEGGKDSLNFSVDNPLRQNTKNPRNTSNVNSNVRRKMQTFETHEESGDDRMTRATSTQLRTHGVNLRQLLAEDDLDVPVLKDRLKRNWIVSILALVWLIYMPVARALFDVFDCREIKCVSLTTRVFVFAPFEYYSYMFSFLMQLLQYILLLQQTHLLI